MNRCKMHPIIIQPDIKLPKNGLKERANVLIFEQNL